MEGFFYWNNGEPVTASEVRVKEFVTGKAKMQYKRLGVVELADSAVHCFYVRHDHNPDHATGQHQLLGGQWIGKSFEDVVDGLRDFEAHWITEELEERATY